MLGYCGFSDLTCFPLVIEAIPAIISINISTINETCIPDTKPADSTAFKEELPTNISNASELGIEEAAATITITKLLTNPMLDTSLNKPEAAPYEDFSAFDIIALLFAG